MKTFPRINLLRALLLIAFFPTPAGGAARAFPDLTPYMRPDAQIGFSKPPRVLRLETIRVTGNHRTSKQIILDHMQLTPGDAVSAELIEADQLRLLATDYFSQVDVSTRPGSTRGAVVLVVEVKERGYPSFETGFGFHDLHGWFLTLGGLRFDNPFGVESRLRIGARLGFRLAGVDAEWVKPLSPEGRFALALEFHSYGMQHRFFGSGPGETSGGGADLPSWQGEGWSRFEQQIQRSGGEVAFNYGTRQPVRFSFGISAELINPDSTFSDPGADKDLPYDDLPGVLKSGVGETVHTGFFLRAIRDTRDNPAYPRSGSFARYTLEVYNSFLGGDEIFTKTTADIRKHFDLHRGRLLSSRLNGGITTRGTPYYDRFYLGGIYSIRGFEEWSLSQTDGDDGYWLASLELRWPLAGRARVSGDPVAPRLSALVFFDAGQGWRRDEAFSTSGVESAAGYGVRLRLPWLGTLGFDVGVPFSNGRTDHPFRLHGSIGFSF